MNLQRYLVDYNFYLLIYVLITTTYSITICTVICLIQVHTAKRMFYRQVEERCCRGNSNGERVKEVTLDTLDFVRVEFIAYAQTKL